MPETKTDDLTRLIAEATVLAGGDHPCNILGHKWEFRGGMACDCKGGGCSFPVHECASCGDCDYGDNDEAAEIKVTCQQREEAYAVIEKTDAIPLELLVDVEMAALRKARLLGIDWEGITERHREEIRGTVWQEMNWLD